MMHISVWSVSLQKEEIRVMLGISPRFQKDDIEVMSRTIPTLQMYR
jgi:hypothetical protein